MNISSNKYLTYCTNIHPGEEWDEVREQLLLNIPELKKRLCPEKPFGIGLRLSAIAAEQLLAGDNLQHFKDWLEKENLFVFTMNGFPYGSFHKKVVKDKVYKPDWRSEERVDYTLNLARILAVLLPDDMDGGISTSPLSYKYWFNEQGRREAFQQSSLHLARVAYEMSEIRKRSGKVIHIDIEPEPDCLLENSRETISFFKDRLLPAGCRFLEAKYGLSRGKAEEIIRAHIQVCFDTCHFSVEYENPAKALEAFKKAEIQIGKVQISSALKVSFESDEKEAVISKLRAFEEKTYLHQVVERRRDGSLHQYRDLGQAFQAESDPLEWRIHYHVPIFVGTFDGLGSTRDDIKTSLRLLLNNGNCTHFEIETYTWSVLPGTLKRNITDSIEREYNWVVAQIDSVMRNSEVKELK